MQTKRILASVWVASYFLATSSLQASPSTNTDLAIGKSASVAVANVGGDFSYQLTVTNIGPFAASSATVVDVLPAGVQYLSTSGPGTYSATNGQWVFDPGSVGTVSVLTIQVQAIAAGNWTNTATIASSIPPDPDPANNTAQVGVKIDSPANPIVLTCPSNIVVTAKGPPGATVFFNSSASGGCSNYVNVFSTPPSGSTFPPGTTTVTTEATDPCGNSTNCSFTVTVNSQTYPPIVLTCSSNLVVAAGGSNGATVFFSTSAYGGCSSPLNLSSIPGSGTFFPIGTNVVITTASDSCGNSTNCDFTVIVTGNNSPAADLQITKTVQTNAIAVGDYAYFMIAITNIGPTAASNAVVTDVLPPGLSYDGSGEPFGTVYNQTNGIWSITNLPPGAGYALYVTAVATNTGIFTNVATLTASAPPDTNAANNSASAVLAVTPAPQPVDLQIVKTASSTNTPAGTQIVFQLQLQNRSSVNVTNTVVVTDLLPPGLKYVTDSTVGGVGVGKYNPATGAWTLTNGDGPGLTLYLYITAAGTNAGPYTNTATVAVPPGYTDYNLTNNTSIVVGSVYYTLSGYVYGCQTNGPAIPYTTVTLSGRAGGTTFTDTNGFYVFSNLYAGTYTVTPSQAGNTFSPTVQTVTNLSTNVVLALFQGNIPQVRGKVTYGTNGLGIPGIYVQLAGTGRVRTELTDSNGVYSFTNAMPAQYTVTPLATNGFVFAPTNAQTTVSATNCVGVASFVSAPRLVQLAGLEVVQVIQNWSNSIVLIQNKETWVRAHLQLLAATNPPVLVQGARIIGPGGVMQAPINPGGTLLVRSTNAAQSRVIFTNSLNFRLPAAWLAGTIDLQFQATNFLTVMATNVVPTNLTAQVTFTPSRPLPLRIYPINWRRAPDRTLQESSAANLADLPRRLLSIYPVPSVNSSVAEPILATFTALPQQADYTALNRQLSLIRASMTFWGINWEYRIYHGVVARGTGDFPATGEADRTGWISSSLMPNNTDFYSDPFLRHLASHEIGHNLGMQHDVSGPAFGYASFTRMGREWVRTVTANLRANSAIALGACDEAGPTNYIYPLFQPIPSPAGALGPALGTASNGVNALVYGLDTLTRANAPELNPVADPNADYDVMSYCRHAPLQWWTSSYTYPAMLNYINNNFIAGGGGGPAPGPAAQMRFFRGSIDYFDNTASFLPAYDMIVTNGYVPPTPVPGPFSLRLFDALGNLLDEIPFTPVNDADESLDENDDGNDDTSPPETGSFVIVLPVSEYASPVATVQLWESGSQMLAQETMSANQPQFTSGVSLTQNSNEVALTWGAVSAVAYMVQYSADGGATWDTLEVDATNSIDDIDPGYLPASSHGLFRVIATDGFDSTNEVSTTPVVVPNHPPSLILSEPLDGTSYIAAQQLLLSAVANDMQDGPLDGTNVQWSSSINGFLGFGANLNIEADTLTPGAHIITVSATDSEGLTASVSVTIYVLADYPPSLSIETSGDHVLVSWPSSVTNYILESASRLAPADWSTVTNLPAAADITQTVTLDLGNTNQFFRLRLP